MAYDQARQQIVFFGGPYGGSAYGNQTWVWDGATWTQKFPATVPPGRYSPGLAYDGIHQQVVMFGGATATAILSDTWVWDGTNWTQKAVGMPGPAGRINHGMAFDGQEILLFGGWDEDFAGFVVYGDTWAWDGNSWTEKCLPSIRGRGRISAWLTTQRAIRWSSSAASTPGRTIPGYGMDHPPPGPGQPWFEPTGRLERHGL